MEKMKMKFKLSLFFLLSLLIVYFACYFVSFVPVHVQASGEAWLTGWSYRKAHTINNATGAGTNYQIKVKVTYNTTELSASNVPSPSVPTGVNGYLTENIVYDSVTENYWWVFCDRTGDPVVVRMANATSLSGPWTVEATPVISEEYDCGSPCIAKFGAYWYIYYGESDTHNIFVQKSSSVNTGYSADGISNPIVSKGSGTWDNNRVLEPYVFLVGSTYYLFYMGENATTLYEKVGYATSSSPTSGFTKYGSNPVLNGDHGWDSGQDKAADPFVFELQDVYYIGVTACSSGKTEWKIGFYTTTDFVTFTHCTENPVLDWGPVGSWDEDTVLRGAVSEFNDILYFAYAGGWTFQCGLTALEILPNLNEHCRTDFGDVRFTDGDGSTLLDYWLEEKVDEDYAIFWVEVADSLESSAQTIYLYYGKADATDISDGDNVFLLFDDFPGSSLNTTKWNSFDTVTVADSEVTIGNWPSNYINSTATFPTNRRLRAFGKLTSYTTGNYGIIAMRIAAGDGDCLQYISNLNVENQIDAYQWDTGWTSYLNVGATGAYHTYEILRNATTSGTYVVDDVQKVNFGTQVPSTSLYVWASYIDMDWIFVAKYVGLEPFPGIWGEEATGNNAPTNEGVTITNMDDTNYLFSMKRNYTVVGLYNDTDGPSTLDHVMVSFTDDSNGKLKSYLPLNINVGIFTRET